MNTRNPHDIFVRLGEFFLFSFNPKLDRDVVILECLHSYDQPIPQTRPIRHTAHDFIRACERIIEKDMPVTKNPSNQVIADLEHWISDWNKAHGTGAA
jgi:hypothetical protein